MALGGRVKEPTFPENRKVNRAPATREIIHNINVGLLKHKTLLETL